MKKVLGFICALIFVMGVYGVAGAATVTIDPSAIDPVVGSTFTMSIGGIEFPDTVGGDVLVEWDPDILTLISPTDVTQTWPGDTWGVTPPNPGDPPIVAAGSISISSGAFGTPVSGPDFGIADLMFTAAAEGVSDIILTATFWSDATFTPIPGVTAESATVGVAPVPIPGSILLLGSGLVGLIGLVRRRRS